MLFFKVIGSNLATSTTENKGKNKKLQKLVAKGSIIHKYYFDKFASKNLLKELKNKCLKKKYQANLILNHSLLSHNLMLT